MITRRQLLKAAACLPILPAMAEPLPVLRGKNIALSIGTKTVNYSGKTRTATTINNSVPGPVLHWKQGDTVTLNITNHLPVQSSIHWHGIILPSNMDGVPGLSYAGINPGQTFQYQFKLQQSGTYWYHSHSGFQEQTGMYGAIVIDPIGPEIADYQRDYVVLLSDWSDEKPQRIFANLRKNSHFYNRNRRTLTDTLTEIRTKGVKQTLEDRAMWNSMGMEDSDISDVTGFTYKFLMNGQTNASPWQGLFKKGEKIRLRFINGSAMTFFDVGIPGLKMQVIASDGQAVEPITVDDARLGVAETLDVIVTPETDMPYAIFAQAMDRSGAAIGHLTPRTGLLAAQPSFDPVPKLTHTDMGMAMNMAAMPAHHHHPVATPISHPETEYGPHVDMRAENPQYRLNDPGVGLREHAARGRRVLCYSDLVNRYPHPVQEPDREIELHLTGNMSRYVWSIDGVPYDEADPLVWKFGERLRVTFVNDTMMNHPMHLHGMWSELETGEADRLPNKHTTVVQPGAKLSYQVNVNARGKWAYHCHLLYHMMGMFREVHVL